MMDVKTIDSAVTPVRTALKADGYDLRVEPTDRQVVMRIVAGPEACEDCLVPPMVMKAMIDKALKDAGVGEIAWELVYPERLSPFGSVAAVDRPPHDVGN